MKVFFYPFFFVLFSSFPVIAQKKSEKKENIKSDLYWILLKNGTYLKGHLIILPDNNYRIINSDYLDGLILKRADVKKIGTTDFKNVKKNRWQKKSHFQNKKPIKSLGLFTGALFLPKQIDTSYIMGWGGGFLYRQEFISFFKSPRNLFMESHLEYFNSPPEEVDFSSMQIFRMGISVAYDTPFFSSMKQNFGFSAGISYGYLQFFQEISGRNQFNMVLFQFGLAYSIFSRKNYSIQIAVRSDIEKQLELVITPKINLRLLWHW